jgi:hypothetical protein
MLAGEELLTVFSRIRNRVKTGDNNYQTLLKVLSARADAEDKIASIIKQVAAEPVDKEDQLLCDLMEDFRSEADEHTKFGNDIRTLIISPLKMFGAGMVDRAKKFMTVLKKDEQALSKAMDDLEKAKRAVEGQAVVERSQGPGVKSDPRKMAKLQSDLDAKIKKADEVSTQIKSSTLADHHSGFAELDGNRLATMQGSIRKLGKLRMDLAKKKRDQTVDLLGKVDEFDGKGRSERYVKTVFGSKPNEQINANARPFGVVISDYRSEDPTDLRLVRGDRIRVLSQHSSGWWMGETEDGRKGHFPRTFVELPGDRPPDIPIEATFLVVEDYQKPKGLKLLAGDLAYVDHFDRRSKLAAGTNLRTGQKGTFEMDVLETHMARVHGQEKPAEKKSPVPEKRKQ